MIPQRSPVLEAFTVLLFCAEPQDKVQTDYNRSSITSSSSFWRKAVHAFLTNDDADASAPDKRSRNRDASRSMTMWDCAIAELQSENVYSAGSVRVFRVEPPLSIVLFASHGYCENMLSASLSVTFPPQSACRNRGICTAVPPTSGRTKKLRSTSTSEVQQTTDHNIVTITFPLPNCILQA